MSCFMFFRRRHDYYLRASDIVKNAIHEIEAQGWAVSDAWHNHLASLIVDVKPGEKLTAKRNGTSMQMYLNGDTLIGSVSDDAAFCEAFFSIWLGEKTSHQSLRRRLLKID